METSVGQVTHYFNHLSVAVLSISHEIKINDILHFCGHTTDFYQKIWSMQVEHSSIQAACPGMEVAVEVAEPVHKGDQVFLVVETTPEDREIILMQQFREWEEKA